MYSSRAQQGGHSTNYNVAEAAEACDRRIAELEEELRRVRLAEARLRAELDERCKRERELTQRLEGAESELTSLRASAGSDRAAHRAADEARREARSHTMEAQRKARESAQQAAQAQALVALERDNTARQVARVLSAAIRISQQGNAHDVKGVPTGVVTVLAGPPPADDSMQAAASAVVAAFAEQDHAASAAVVRAVRSSEQLSGLADAVAAAQGTAFGGDSLRGALLEKLRAVGNEQRQGRDTKEQLDQACRVLTSILEAVESQPPAFPREVCARLRELLQPVLC